MDKEVFYDSDVWWSQSWSRVADEGLDVIVLTEEVEFSPTCF